MDISKEYFKLLGGNNFPRDTTARVNNFSKELEIKRNYNKFTVFDTTTDEMIVINKIKLFSFLKLKIVGK